MFELFFRPNTTFLTFSIFSQSSAALESKKVPPRNPTDRIKTLNRFTQSWLTKIIAIKYVRPIRAHRMVSVPLEMLAIKLKL